MRACRPMHLHLRLRFVHSGAVTRPVFLLPLPPHRDDRGPLPGGGKMLGLGMACVVAGLRLPHDRGDGDRDRLRLSGRTFRPMEPEITAQPTAASTKLSSPSELNGLTITVMAPRR